MHRNACIVFPLVLALVLTIPGISVLAASQNVSSASKAEKKRRLNSKAKLLKSGDNLQDALNSAVPGDTLMLQAGAQFVGNFVLPVTMENADWITITSSAVTLPLPGVRVSPSDADAMPKILTPNGKAVLSTVPGSSGFKFIGIEFSLTPDVANSDGLILLGDGSSAQNSDALVPSDFLFDRCFLHGMPLSNAKRGIALNCASATIQNCYLSDFHAIGFDAQAMAGWNGPGPFTIQNNYIEGSGENLMFGGADPSIPNLTPSDILISQNLFSKPLTWKDGILTAVTGLAAAGETVFNGALPSNATYYYRVYANTMIQPNIPVNSPSSGEVSATVQAGQNAVALTWTAAQNATAYTVYQTSDPPSTASRSWQSFSVSAPTTQFVVSAVSSTSGVVPPVSATHWSVKNLLELKNASRVKIKANVFENNWLDAQTGYAISLKSVNQDGTAPWSGTSDVLFTLNVVRNVASAINVLGEDPHFPSQRENSISITYNLFYNIVGAALGGDGTFLQISDAENVSVDHNTVLQTGNIITTYGLVSPGFSFTNNIAPSNSYGIKGDGTASGAATLTAYFPDLTCMGNVFAGATSPPYPPNNFYPATLADIGFIDLANGNFRLNSNSVFHGSATDGTDPGANIPRLLKMVGSV